jgi:hypothetical protein
VRNAGMTPLREANEPTSRQAHLSVRMPEDLYDALRQLAAAEERSVAGFIRYMVRERAETEGLLEWAD